MSKVLKLRGAAAFSATRLARLLETARQAVPALTKLAAEHWYFVECDGDLNAAEMARLGLAAPRPGEPMYRITVALALPHVMAYGRPQPLAAGMQLEADVLLERRRLVEWLFEPLLGLAGRL